jgi:tetratricopeptide (TPR) repeat protein
MAASQAADADPVSGAVVSPEASLFTRELLKNALANPAAASAPWREKAQALLANVLMNDVLNWWNNADAAEVASAQNAVNQAGNSALAQHVQGLIHRQRGNHAGARSAFQQAVATDSRFARAHAQLGNQKALDGQASASHGDFAHARNLAPIHPASGYFYWGEGRAYFEEQDWAKAIDCLTKSVAALPSVWYNRCYLAAAQDAAGNSTAARQTVQDFISRFDQATFTRIKQLDPNDPNHPGRKRVLDFVIPLLP